MEVYSGGLRGKGHGVQVSELSQDGLRGTWSTRVRYAQLQMSLDAFRDGTQDLLKL